MKGIETYVAGFLFHCQYERNLSDKTLKAYRIDLRQFREFLAEHAPAVQVELIDKEMLREYIRHVSQGNKPKTIKRKLATAKAFFNYLEFDGAIVANPFRKIRVSIKEGKILPKTIPRCHLGRLFDSVYTKLDAASAGAAPALTRDIAVLELLFETGVRVAELCSLKRENIDLDSRGVKIMGKGTRERFVPLCSEAAIKAVVAYDALYHKCNDESEGWFFINRDGRRLSEQSVRSIIRKHGKGAEIANKITPHMFRHSIATQLLENGVDIRYIQTFLGHSSITTTQIYAQVSQEAQRAVLEMKHPRREYGEKGGVEDN
jgi:integrase/recombinase XerD